MELRHEHALKNWKRHSVDWFKLEEKIAKKLKKDPAELSMAKISEYRLVMEERELVEEAYKFLEKNDIDFWKTGLRVGSDLLGITLTMPKGGPREVERLRVNEKVA